MLKRTLATTLAIFCLSWINLASADNPSATIATNYGDIEIELLENLAPRTVKNFISLIDETFYDGLIFHRVIANFMIQTGGYAPDMTYMSDDRTLPNESFNRVKNSRGTLAMARLNDPDSAGTQFFINVRDNPNLDASGTTAGYTVFGRVSSGMEVVEEIELVNTHLFQGHAAVPEEPVIIRSIRLND
ncbi:MAG: cyclophilin family peptidyl-prolyl cis-trans isomerase [Limisphaerales bacterium]|jgi:cyclophilin family peptidyl-prolyl cis-trans isomerase